MPICDICLGVRDADTRLCGHALCPACRQTGYCPACVVDRLWKKKFGRKRPRASGMRGMIVGDANDDLQIPKRSSEEASSSNSKTEKMMSEHPRKIRRRVAEATACSRMIFGRGDRRLVEDGSTVTDSFVQEKNGRRSCGAADPCSDSASTSDTCADPSPASSPSEHLVHMVRTTNVKIDVENYDLLLYIPPRTRCMSDDSQTS